MKGTILVILKKEVTDPIEALEAALVPWRLDEDDPISIRNHHWDYWTIDECYTDNADTPTTPEKPFFRVSQISRDKPVSAILTPDGAWQDMQDFGWKMTHEPSRKNKKALSAWRLAETTIKSLYKDHLAAFVLYHC